MILLAQMIEPLLAHVSIVWCNIIPGEPPDFPRFLFLGCCMGKALSLFQTCCISVNASGLKGFWTSRFAAPGELHKIIDIPAYYSRAAVVLLELLYHPSWHKHCLA